MGGKGSVGSRGREGWECRGREGGELGEREAE